MEVQLINKKLLSELHERAAVSERLRMNFDLRTSTYDTSQWMLNAQKLGTHVSIHRHLNTSESVICIEGCLDWIFYEELPNMDADGPIYDGETVVVESGFKKLGRYRVCPREGLYGIQVPKGVWHSIVVREQSTIFEAKYGVYRK